MEHRNPLLHGESDSKFITIGESMLRLSVGLEDAEDIIADLKAGLDNLQK